MNAALHPLAGSAPHDEHVEIVDDVLTSRHSVRAFLTLPVPRPTVEELLTVASRAPSGSNIQPWKVFVLQGASLAELTTALTQAHMSDVEPNPDYQYYGDEWSEPYLSRRRRAGWGLYTLAGVARGDREAAQLQRARNYRFFDAPVGLVFCQDPALGQGSLIDMGMFMQNVMIAARARGLDTCPQAAIANYPDVVRAHLGLPDEQRVICGMALGYADPDDPTNTLKTEREGLNGFVTFLGEDIQA